VSETPKPTEIYQECIHTNENVVMQPIITDNKAVAVSIVILG
jgi:hypothetical protein